MKSIDSFSTFVGRTDYVLECEACGWRRHAYGLGLEPAKRHARQNSGHRVFASRSVDYSFIAEDTP